MINAITEWKKKVWIMNYEEGKIERLFKKGDLKKKDYRRAKALMDKAWIKIWELHPDKSDEEIATFNKLF